MASASDPEAAADIEATAGLIGTLITRRTERQWQTIDAVDAAPTQRAAAEALGVSPQNVSQALAASAIAVERAGYPVLVRLLGTLASFTVAVAVGLAANAALPLLP